MCDEKTGTLAQPQLSPSSCKRARPHVPESHVIPHPPYSPDLALCDFALVPKLKMKLKGRRFETVTNIQRESQVVLDSMKENDFHGPFEA
jgi:hypothetical protein